MLFKRREIRPFVRHFVRGKGQRATSPVASVDHLVAGDGTALYRTPSGSMFHGKWEIKGNTLCAEWRERPNTGCIRYEKTGDAVKRSMPRAEI